MSPKASCAHTWGLRRWLGYGCVILNSGLVHCIQFMAKCDVGRWSLIGGGGLLGVWPGKVYLLPSCLDPSASCLPCHGLFLLCHADYGMKRYKLGTKTNLSSLSLQMWSEYTSPTGHAVWQSAQFRVRVIHPCDQEATWHLQLSVTTQPHDTVSHHTSIARKWPKLKNLNCYSCRRYTLLLYHWKVKKLPLIPLQVRDCLDSISQLPLKTKEDTWPSSDQ